MTVLVDSGLTEGRQAPALDGRYTAGDALRRLLAGSPLSIRYASEYSFTLVADPRPARPRQPRLRDTAHAARLQAALRRVLCAAAGTAPGGYRALVQLWFDGDARVSKMNWITRSGLAARDQALGMPWLTCARALAGGSAAARDRAAGAARGKAVRHARGRIRWLRARRRGF